MASVIIFHDPDGREVAFEVADSKLSGRSGARQVSGAAQKSIQKATSSLADAMDGIPSVLNALRQKMKGQGIEEAEATLGLKLSGDAKFVVASASAEASLTIKIKIKPE